MTWIDNLICLTVYCIIGTLIIVGGYYLFLYIKGGK